MYQCPKKLKLVKYRTHRRERETGKKDITNGNQSSQPERNKEHVQL